MNKRAVKLLKELEQMEDVRGKKRIEQLIWANSNDPKFKVDEVVKVTQPGYYIWGNRVKGFVGVVKKYNVVLSEKTFAYEIEVKCDNGESQTTTTLYLAENSCGGYIEKTRAKNVVNKIAKKSKYSDSMDALM